MAELGDGKGKQEAKEINEELSFILDAVSSIGDKLVSSFQDAVDEAGNLNSAADVVSKTIQRGFISDLKKAVKNTEDLVGLQVKANQGLLKSSEVEKMRIKIQQNQAQLDAKIQVYKLNGLKLDEKSIKAQQEQNEAQLKSLDSIENANKEFNKTLSFTQVFGKNISEAANRLDKTGTLSEILKGNIKDVLTPTRILELAFTAIGTAALSANKSVTGLQKQLGISSLKATALRLQLSATSNSANDLRVTTETLIKAQTELNNSYQTAALFNSNIAVGATSALDAQIMSGEAVSQLAGDAARLGVTFDQSLQTQEDAVNAINSQTGAQISLKTVLEDSNKVSGQIRAQLGANPEAIARAVTQAKALGFELEQIAASGEALLNFEQSIEAELQAELLTGKQLNLERARLAALTGDYETLTAEIAANVGDFNEFSSMNVLQQKAIAESVGMTADQLANSLITEENRSQLLADAIASGNEQSVQQLKALDTQEKFNKAVEQLKGLFVDVATVLSPVVDFVGLIAEGMSTTVGKTLALGGIVMGLIPAFKALKALQIATSIASMFKGPLGIATGIAGTLALVGAINKYSKADDMAYGDNMLVTKNKGTIMLNNQDSVIAGTNLGGGSGGEKFDYNKMAAAMSQVQISTTTNYNGFQAKSSHAMRGSYSNDVKYNGSKIA